MRWTVCVKAGTRRGKESEQPAEPTSVGWWYRTSFEVARAARDLTGSADLLQPLPKPLLFVGYHVSQSFPLASLTVPLKYLAQGNLSLDASLLLISLVSV